MTVTGSLRDLDGGQIVNLLMVARKTGVLTIQGQNHAATIHLKEGKPLYAFLDEEKTGLTELLRDAGKLTPEQCRIIPMLLGARSDEELALMLVKAGIVNEEDIVAARRYHSLYVVRTVLTWDEGSFEFEPDVLPRAEAEVLEELPEGGEPEPGPSVLEAEVEEVEPPVPHVATTAPPEEGEAEDLEPSVPEAGGIDESELPTEEQTEPPGADSGPPAEEAPPEQSPPDSSPSQDRPPIEEEATPPHEGTDEQPTSKLPDAPSARRADGDQDVERWETLSSRHPTSRRRELHQLGSRKDPRSIVRAIGRLGRLGNPTPALPEAIAAPSPAVAAAVAQRPFGQLAAVLPLPHLEERQLALASALGYLLLIAMAEVMVTFVEPRVGMAIHGGLLIILLVHSALASKHSYHALLLSLSLAPLIRMLSLSMPLMGFPLLYWYPIVGVPLFVATIVAARTLGFSRRQLGLTIRRVPLQLVVAATGLIFGVVEYYILRPEPLVAAFSWQSILLPALVLMASTGFGEELIFRGLMQRASMRALGQIGWLYVALLFAVLHVGYRSVVDVIFVLGVALLFGWAVQRTRSLLGVTLAHGLTNVVLFLVMPFWGG